MSSIREFLDGLDREFVLLEPAAYDAAIVGLTEDDQVCYDRDKVLDILRNQMDVPDAEEYFEYNIAGSHVGEHSPVFVTMFSNLLMPEMAD